MLAPTADFYRLRTPVGHELTDQRWKDLLAAADPSALESITYSSFSPSLTVDEMARSPILDQLAVRYWVDSPRRTVGDRDRLPDSGDGEVTLEPGGEAACTVPGARCAVSASSSPRTFLGPRRVGDRWFTWP